MPKFFTALFLILFAAYSLAHAEPAPTNNIPASELPEVLLGYFNLSDQNELQYVVRQFDKPTGSLKTIHALSANKYGVDPSDPPQISPDNKKIVYSSSEAIIYVLNLETLERIKLPSNSKKSDREPRWSPNGKKVLYRSHPNSEPCIVIVDADGKNKKVITLKSNEQINSEYPVEWSPDSKKIAYTSGGQNSTPHVWVIDIENNQKYNLTASNKYGFAPSWSPNSKKVTYVSDGEEIYISNYRGEESIKLTNSDYRNHNPDCLLRLKLNDEPQWSPDGTKIIFWSERNCSKKLYTANTITETIKPIFSPENIQKTDPFFESSPERRFIFYSNTNDSSNIYEIYIFDTETNHSNLIDKFSIGYYYYTYSHYVVPKSK